MESATGEERGHRFLLVHGVCHGAWCWYRVATILRSAGHRVDALDMASCGASPGRAVEVGSFEEYSRPLLDELAALPPGEKAVLVGHSYGGQSLALAIQAHPDRIAVAVFASAAMPVAGKPMKFVSEQVRARRLPLLILDPHLHDPRLLAVHDVVCARKGPGFLQGLRDRDRRRRPPASLQDVPARTGVHGGETVPAQPTRGEITTTTAG
jgi:pimeloyl-ACP methyl ester carboxylesterase